MGGLGGVGWGGRSEARPRERTNARTVGRSFGCAQEAERIRRGWEGFSLAVCATATTAAATTTTVAARLIGETVPATGGTVSQRSTGRTGQGHTLTRLSVLSTFFFSSSL